MNKNSRSQAVAPLAFTALLLAACGSEQKPAEQPPVENAVLRDMTGAMDKARGVEATLQQQKESLDRTLQENENPTAE